MKVLDLGCLHHHVFEGWFASEEDFLDQQRSGLIECPICGDATITKRMSAPRLNLNLPTRPTSLSKPEPSPRQAEMLQMAWMAAAQHMLANTDDVGSQFAAEARKIHYGESKERGIRGNATREERESLIDEGIEVMSMPLPEALKRPLQ